MKKSILPLIICIAFIHGMFAQPGNVGINTLSPQARLHIVRNMSGGPLLSNALAIFEDNQHSFIQLSHFNNAESGILSGNQSTLIRAGLIFGMDSSILFRSGGNISRMAIKQNGRVGINTISPMAMFHVKDSSVLFSGSVTLSFTAKPPVSGAGTRMMWYVEKASFRAGQVDGTHWDRDSVGLRSVAMGLNTKAKGFTSTALGSGTSAIGDVSTAIGLANKAQGSASTAMGLSTKAIGNISTSMGSTTTARADHSTTMGNNTIARAFASLVIGRFNDTTTAVPSLFNWFDADPLFVIGNGIDGNNRSNAITVLKNARTGINTTTPDAMLHVSEGAGGGIYHSASDVIIEDDAVSYLQFSNPGTFESGILSGNNVSSVRSAIMFRPDSSLQMRAGGNTTRLAILKNGNIGINTIAPQKLLHVSGGTSAAAPVTSAVAVFEDNSDASINLLTPASSEGGIYFGNSEDAAHGGIVYNSTVTNGLAFRTNKNVTKMVITDVGNVGIGDNSPNARFHVSGGTGGTIYNAEADMIVEDNSSTFIQLSSPVSSESGILSGNNLMDTRSSIRFKADSSIHMTTAGNTSRMMISNTGEVGIGGSPDATLDVHGTTKLGNNGTILTEVIKLTVNHDIIPMLANGSALEAIPVPNATIGSSVFISPGIALQNGIVIAYARVSAAGVVEARFINTTAGAINPPAMDFYITVVR